MAQLSVSLTDEQLMAFREMLDERIEAKRQRTAGDIRFEEAVAVASRQLAEGATNHWAFDRTGAPARFDILGFKGNGEARVAAEILCDARREAVSRLSRARQAGSLEPGVGLLSEERSYSCPTRTHNRQPRNSLNYRAKARANAGTSKRATYSLWCGR